MMSLMAFLTLNALMATQVAATNDTQKPVEPRPKVQQGEVPKPVVTIRQTKEATITEYRINGVLRAIKYVPKNGGKPYYLIDREGNGEFVRFGPDMGPQVQVPQWIVLTW
ncbi:MAG: DUF2782 domain-containing protein [Gammaproteobacteria bacterium]|nr:MAG: DUF2782 domain-containing protein [Gammaproteobacteria bacterium]